MLFKILKQSIADFFRLKVLKLSASLAFFTFFSFPSVLVLICWIITYLYGKNTLEIRLHNQIQQWLGDTAGIQIKTVLKTINLNADGTLSAWAAFIMQSLTTIGIFTEMQDSVKSIWEVREKKNLPWWQQALKKTFTLLLIIIVGILMAASMMMNWAIDLFSRQIEEYVADNIAYIISVLNYASLFILFGLFSGFIYKFLPEARVKWKDAAVGAFWAGFLFITGKFTISLYMGVNITLSAYTTTSAMILVLIWVYYSSVVLLGGAVITKNYAKRNQRAKKPMTKAV